MLSLPSSTLSLLFLPSYLAYLGGLGGSERWQCKSDVCSPSWQVGFMTSISFSWQFSMSNVFNVQLSSTTTSFLSGVVWIQTLYFSLLKTAEFQKIWKSSKQQKIPEVQHSSVFWPLETTGRDDSMISWKLLEGITRSLVPKVLMSPVPVWQSLIHATWLLLFSMFEISKKISWTVGNAWCFVCFVWCLSIFDVATASWTVSNL